MEKIEMRARRAAAGERLRACPEILFWVEQATGLYRPATRRAEWEGRPEAMKMGLLQRAAALFRSAGRRPARAGRPCYPFSRQALMNLREASSMLQRSHGKQPPGLPWENAPP